MKEVGSLIDKILLVGITLLDDQGELLEQIQVYGPIIKIDSDGIVISRNGTGSNFIVPPDFNNITEAQPGEYKLSTTGEVVVNPDFISSWTVNSASHSSVELYSSVGFGGYERA